MAGFLTSPNFVEHEVNGKTLKFYPVSLGTALKLRTIAKPLASAITTLFAGGDKDVGSKVKETTSNEGSVYERIVDAISPDLAKMRQDRVDFAVRDLIDALTKDESLLVVAELFADSCRDEWQRPVPPAQIKAIKDELDTESLPQVLAGLAKANRKLFGPLGDRISELSKLLGPEVDKLVKQLQSRTSAPASS